MIKAILCLKLFPKKPAVKPETAVFLSEKPETAGFPKSQDCPQPSGPWDFSNFSNCLLLLDCQTIRRLHCSRAMICSHSAAAVMSLTMLLRRCPKFFWIVQSALLHFGPLAHWQCRKFNSLHLIFLLDVIWYNTYNSVMLENISKPLQTMSPSLKVGSVKYYFQAQYKVNSH